MPRIRYTIEIAEGSSVELLFSATLGFIAERKGIQLILEHPDDKEENVKFFVKLLYLAALNAWEFKTLDEPGLGEFPYKAIDFAEWAAREQKAFADMIVASAEAMSGLLETGKKGAADVKKK
jgi:hypothetical protein